MHGHIRRHRVCGRVRVHVTLTCSGVIVILILIRCDGLRRLLCRHLGVISVGCRSLIAFGDWSSGVDCRFWPLFPHQVIAFFNTEILHILVQAVSKDICLATSRGYLVLLLVSVNVSAAIFRSEAAASAEVPCGLGASSVSFRVEQSLPPLDQLSLLLQLLLFHLGLLPILVRDPGHDSAISLRPGLLALLCFLLLSLHLLMHLLLSLLDQRPLKPLLEAHIADLLAMLLLEALAFILLQFQQLIVLDMHSFAALPLGHLVRALLHADGFLFLLLDESLEEVSLGFDD